MDRKRIPEDIRESLPVGAQEEYENALNSAFERFDDASEIGGRTNVEDTAHKLAWAAVKRKYEKGEDGKWHPKRQK